MTPRIVHAYKLLAINRKDGTIAWERTPKEEVPHEASHQDNGTWASSSAVTDGQHVIASFESRGLYCYDMNGTLVWQKDLGDKKMRNEFGEGSTPALHGNTLVVVWDHYVPGASFIVALDKRTGNELWRVSRDEIDTWATPLIVEHDGRGPGHRSRHEQAAQLRPEDRRDRLGDGRPHDEPDSVAGRRRRHGVRDERLPRQQPQGDSTGGREGRHHGDTGNVVWTLDRDTPYVPSPLLYDGVLYILKTNNGLLSAFEREHGQAALSGAAAGEGAERVCVAHRRRRTRLYSRAATARRSC